MDDDVAHSMSTGGSPIALTHSLTRFWLIYPLNIFLLHPLIFFLRIFFVQECSVVFKKVFWQGLARKVHILHGKWRAGNEFVEHFRRLKSVILVSRVFLPWIWRICCVFAIAHRLSLTRRSKLIEVFMTVVINRSQQHDRRCQRIVTRHVGSQRQSQKLKLSQVSIDK